MYLSDTCKSIDGLLSSEKRHQLMRICRTFPYKIHYVFYQFEICLVLISTETKNYHPLKCIQKKKKNKTLCDTTQTNQLLKVTWQLIEKTYWPMCYHKEVQYIHMNTKKQHKIASTSMENFKTIVLCVSFTIKLMIILLTSDIYMKKKIIVVNKWIWNGMGQRSVGISLIRIRSMWFET